MRRTQQGYLALLAIIFIMVIGFIGITVVNQFAGSANAVNDFTQSDQTFYIANAGLQKAARQLLTPFLSGSNPRISCAAITGNTNVTNSSFSTGTFTVTTVSGSPVYTNTTLSSSVTSSVTSIPVASTSGFASTGQLMIDREVMSYGGISGNSFIGVQRGINHSAASSHASAAPVSQYQCSVNSLAGIPSVASPRYQRQMQLSIPEQEAWAVGAVTGGSYQLTRWNRPTELSWTSAAFSDASAVNLNSVSMLSNADGWAVGNNSATTYTLLHWTGSSWSRISLASACSNQDLYGISSVSSQEAWAVGHIYRTNGTCTSSAGTQRYTILQWNGTSWSALAPTTIPSDAGSNQNLNAVHVIATTGGAGTLGFAVGDKGKILKYNGSTWVADTSPTSQNLLGVHVTSASEAWAVGASGTIIKWNGSTWSTFTSPTSQTLNGIRMLDLTGVGTAQSGWAVGASGTAIQYNGSSWSTSTTGVATTLNKVSVFYAANDAWIAGNSGTLLHWDGSSWTSISSGLSVNLLGISVVPARQSPVAWQEVFP